MFNLDEYTTVRERVIEFWKRYPNGRIETEILDWSDKRFIVGARLYREATDEKPFSTGFAHEVVTDRGVNKDFALENGVTSAIGVACGHANIGIDKHKPSREEMSKVVAAKPLPNVSKPLPKPAVQDLVQDDQDYWTTPVGQYKGVVDAPITLEKALDTVSTIIGSPEAAEVPTCQHGHRVWKTGKSQKTGKEWANYSCPLLGHAGMEGKCEPIWYEINSQGKWQPQKVWA